MKVIEIHGNNPNFLEVDLIEILNLIDNADTIYWDIIWLEGTGVDILALEKKIKKAEKGHIVNWLELNSLIKDISTINEIVLIGSKDIELLKKYHSDEDMQNACDYYIELVDSSYWIVTTKNNKFENCVVRSLPGVRENNSDSENLE